MAFQSTLPRGERPYRNASKVTATEFQSTLPRGERPIEFSFRSALLRVSIHAPARGATALRAGWFSIWSSFNPRSREGSDAGIHQILIYHRRFNPRSREGSDRPCVKHGFYNIRRPASADGQRKGRVSLSGRGRVIDFLHDFKELKRVRKGRCFAARLGFALALGRSSRKHVSNRRRFR